MYATVESDSPKQVFPAAHLLHQGRGVSAMLKTAVSSRCGKEAFNSRERIGRPVRPDTRKFDCMQAEQLRCGGIRAFTLVEILVVIAIIATLLALLLPAARGTVASARSFKCQLGLRSSAFDFTTFADDILHPNRGDDEDLPGRRSFRLETFIEYQYSVDEFWAWGTDTQHNFPDSNGNDPLRCAEVRGTVTGDAGTPCSMGAIQPPQNVSYGFNVRLRFSERQQQAGRNPQVVLTSKILEGQGVISAGLIPLSWDVDGRRAAQIGANPLFSGPSLNSLTLFTNNRYWYPALRHNKGLNVSFVDGHVESTRAPLDQPNWAWGFDPGR